MPDGRASTCAKVRSEQAEVGSVDYCIASEIGSAVITELSLGLAIGVFQDAEVSSVDHIVIVGIARPHCPDFHIGNWRTYKNNRAIVRQKSRRCISLRPAVRPLRPCEVDAISERHRHGEEA